jgi:hypothetical protein
MYSLNYLVVMKDDSNYQGLAYVEDKDYRDKEAIKKSIIAAINLPDSYVADIKQVSFLDMKYVTQAETMGLDQKFYVLSNKDIQEFLKVDDQKRLKAIAYRAFNRRRRAGKKENEYVTINLDEPYIEEILSPMRRHGHARQNLDTLS